MTRSCPSFFDDHRLAIRELPSDAKQFAKYVFSFLKNPNDNQDNGEEEEPVVDAL